MDDYGIGVNRDGIVNAFCFCKKLNNETICFEHNKKIGEAFKCLIENIEKIKNIK